MSAYTMDQVWAPIEASQRQAVLKNTWGHLAPRKHRAYAGRIVYAVGCFGDDDLTPTVIACDFNGLDSSPWFFDAMARFLSDQQIKNRTPGCVWEWRGRFRNYVFTGEIRQLLDTNQ